MLRERFILFLSLGLIGLRWAGQWYLTRRNQLHVESHRGAIPPAFRGTLDEATSGKSVDYTLAKSRFGQWETAWEALVLAGVLASGVLPETWRWLGGIGGGSSWAQAAWLLAVGLALSALSIPFEWWAQFRLEERFGFNTITLVTWILDRVKGLGLAMLLGVPLLVFLLKLVDWMGPLWWLWAWATLLVFQLVMMVLAPILILPLFNKFTPLPEGSLRERLLALGARTGFSARTILVMDGSKRSRHSNAYFTGFGRFRKIVLFDTLITQLTEPELEAVLAHEVGHFKLGHIPKMLIWGAITSLAAFGFIGWLAHEPWFVGAFGFVSGGSPTVAPVLLLFSLLSGLITFWFSPVANFWSRRHEYEADAYAKAAIEDSQPLVGALRKLSEKNLSNLTPHPWFSAFYYSHPTLIEREQALETVSSGRPNV
jgi:STE24 endopeptidase